MSADPLDLRFEKNPSFVTRKVAGETILVPISRSIGNEPCLYTLDEVATFLWDRLDGKATGREAAVALQNAYAVEAPQAETDVRTFLQDLRSIEAIHAATEEIAHPTAGI